MQKRKLILTVISLLLCVLFVFTACSVDKGSDEDKTNSQGEVIDVDGENTDAESTTAGPAVKTPSKEKLVALTYDDGPNPSTTNRILPLTNAWL